MGLRCLLASLTGEVFEKGEISAFFHEVGRRCPKKEEFKIQYNTIFILPYTTFTDGKKKMKKIDDRK